MDARLDSDGACLIRHVFEPGDADVKKCGRLQPLMHERHLMYHSILRDTIPLYKNKGRSCNWRRLLTTAYF